MELFTTQVRVQLSWAGGTGCAHQAVPGSGVHTHEPWEPPSLFKKFNVLLSLSFWKHVASKMENIFWEGKTLLFGMAMLLEVIQGLRKLKKPDPFFEKWQLLNFENACADLLNFGDVLERSVLYVYLWLLSSLLLLCTFSLFYPIFYIQGSQWELNLWISYKVGAKNKKKELHLT